MDIQARLGRNIRRIRGDLGWSQEELAHRADIHRTYISDVERGARNPTISVVEKIAKALKVEAAKLLA